MSKGDKENELVLHYTLGNITKPFETKNLNLVTPFPHQLFDYKHEAVYYDSQLATLYGVIKIDWDGQYQEPEVAFPQDGIFPTPISLSLLVNTDGQGSVFRYDTHFTSFSLTGWTSLAAYFNSLANSVTTDGPSTDINLFAYLLFAFLGGLILNLMPCVLPVISLKLFGLIAHRDEDNQSILKHNMSYTLGVIGTFILFGFTVLFLKSSGEKIGWGFQLQSPTFVFIMFLVIFLMALNMLGLFEFITPGGKKLGNTEIKKGFYGDFISGVLATILSTPCSAPFLGTALTFAFTTSNLNIFLIFTMVGVGLAFPFILTGFFPRLVNFLPKPGMWMEKLKYLLGFSLLLTCVWLYDVLVNLIDYQFYGIYLNTIIATLFFGFFFRKKISKLFIWNLFFFAIPLLLISSFYFQGALTTLETKNSSSSVSSDINWEPWSEEKVKSYIGKQPVFVDFTAKWCLTCKVNKKLVLSTESFERFKTRVNLKTFVADWTKRDDVITDFLAKHNLVGVPAYFIQTIDGKIISLGETISINKIEKNL